jgi:sodium/proline symporter
VFLTVILLYFLALATIGILSSRYNRSLADFLLANRGLGKFTAAISAGASDMSGWLLLGFPGFVYATGASALWVALGLIIGTFANWYLVAQRLRRDSEKYGALTLPDYLESRFAGPGFQWIRLLATLVILVFFAIYVSAQFVGAGKTFEKVTSLAPVAGITVKFQWGVFLGAAVVLLYTMLGGFLAVSLTDVLQGILMLAALVVVPIVGFWSLGGLGRLTEVLANQGNPGQMLSVTGGKAGTSFLFGLLLPGIAWGLGYPGQPHILARFMAIRDPRKVLGAGFIGMVWVVLTLYGAMMVGLLAHGLLTEPPDDRELVLLLVAIDLLPVWLAAVIVSAALAGMMSTADSQLLVLSSSVVQDIFIKIFRIRLSQKGAVLFSRVVVLGVVIIAAVGAILSDESVYSIVAYAWFGLGAGLGPAVLFGLWAPWARRRGIIAGMVVGVATALTWNHWPIIKDMTPPPPTLLPAVLLASLAIISFSLLDKKTRESVEIQQ